MQIEKERPRFSATRPMTLEEQSTPAPLDPEKAREVLEFMGYFRDAATGKLLWKDRFYS